MLGVDVLAGNAAAHPLFDGAGVQIGDMGLERNASPGPNFTAGPEVRAKVTVIADGARGSRAKQLITTYGLDRDSDAQTYGGSILCHLDQDRVYVGYVARTIAAEVVRLRLTESPPPRYLRVVRPFVGAQDTVKVVIPGHARGVTVAP